MLKISGFVKNYTTIIWVAGSLVIALGIAGEGEAMDANKLDNADGGSLHSVGEPDRMFDVAGNFRYFVPGISPGPNKPKAGLSIGFIDSGTTSRHPQLDGLVIEERTFVDGPLQDEVGHGTWAMLVSRIVKPDEVFGYYSAKVTRTGADLRAKSVLQAFDWLVSKGVTTINVSLGFNNLTPDVAALCRKIGETPKVLVLAAAGNMGPDAKSYPAACGLPNIFPIGEWKDGKPTDTSGIGDAYATPPALQSRWAYLLNLGNAAAQTGDKASARRIYLQSLEDTENPGALYELALLDAAENRWVDARPHIERAAALAPENAEIAQTLGAVIFRLGDAPGAEKWFRKALEIDPGNVRALANLARVRALAHDRLGARALLEQVRALEPNFASLQEIENLIDKNSPR